MPPLHGGTAVVRAEPFFLETARGRRFAVHHRPADATIGHVLCVPPFNEEMNRCRSMMTLQAAALARLGLGMLVIDLAGTGDSEGGFGDARWETWLDDVRAAAQWLSQRDGGLRGMLALRMGALLAAPVVAELARPDLALALWQPVVEGKLHLTQFLRVRMAAQLDRPDVAKETPATMRQQFDAGRSVEVAGYEVHPALAASLDGARLADARLPRETRVLWIENASGEDPQLAVPSRKVVDAWAAAGIAVEERLAEGPAFWQVHERVLTPSFVEATATWFGSPKAAA